MHHVATPSLYSLLLLLCHSLFRRSDCVCVHDALSPPSVYGCSELVSPERFVRQLADLHAPAGAAPNVPVD